MPLASLHYSCWFTCENVIGLAKFLENTNWKLRGCWLLCWSLDPPPKLLWWYQINTNKGISGCVLTCLWNIVVKVVSLNVQTKVVVILFMKTGPYSVSSLTRCMQGYKREESAPLLDLRFRIKNVVSLWLRNIKPALCSSQGYLGNF